MTQHDRLWSEFSLEKNCVHFTAETSVRLYLAQMTLALRSVQRIFLRAAGDEESELHIAWQTLPREAGSMRLRDKDSYIRVRNLGVGSTLVEAYSLIATSPGADSGSSVRISAPSGEQPSINAAS